MIQRTWHIWTYLKLATIAAVVVSALLSFMPFADRPHAISPPPIAVVDGEKVDAKEVQLLANAQRAKVYTYFMQRYGLEDSLDFWQTEVGGEKPIQKLKGLTLERLKEIKVQQLWARQEGLIEDIGYESFLQRLHDENESRKKALQEHRVIYGPQQYNADTYYEYVFSNLIIQLKQRLADSAYKPDEEQIHRYYEENKTRYTEKGTAQMEVLFISNKSSQAKELMAMAQQLSQQGTSLKEVVKALTASPAEVQFGEYLLGSKMEETEVSERLKVISAGLSAGQTSGFEQVENGWFMATCLDKTEERAQPLASIRSNVIDDYVHSVYQQELAQRIRNVTVQWDEQQFDKLELR
ncbi:peptidyl-prolyl cis-trans isomerase [Gorillibacterium sp. sgz5001074]|uniref:peptidylprolyl isomerase n=1 Tax=Gorillibacterium sp. sgz5001074 TaxID=3446695 RepID=UPI003F66E5DD